jgi:hypothetical protein
MQFVSLHSTMGSVNRATNIGSGSLAAPHAGITISRKPHPQNGKQFRNADIFPPSQNETQQLQRCGCPRGAKEMQG